MSSSMDTETIDPSVKDSEFVSELATKPLRVCCYGSSSSMTPEKYLKEARSLGYILAKRGHTCVNGAGSFGCMAALNDGAAIGNGHIVGVIHEMFVVDGSDWCVRDGGAHEVFRNPNDRSGPIREILVAGGDDLQERKRLLVEGADALVVLPGGPGTWDELWEMACARNIGLTNLPIVAVNVDGYYENFHLMLERAYKDDMVKNEPMQVVRFVSTSKEAVEWIEQEATKPAKTRPSVKRRVSNLRRSSFMDTPSIGSWFRRLSSMEISTGEERSWENGKLVETKGSSLAGVQWTFYFVISFVAGMALGAAAASRSSKI